jgi:ribosomal protein S18 acetylase RimI-like enzyme
MMGFDVWGDGLSQEQYLEECRLSLKYRRGTWKVLENENAQIVCSLIVYSFGNESFGIGSLATHPEFRNKGFAKHLVKQVLQSLKESSTVNETSKVEVYLYSDIGTEFYENLGFQSLPSELQKVVGSICMVWGVQPSVCSAALGNNLPSYF